MEIKHTIEILTKDIQDIEKLVRNLQNSPNPASIDLDLALSKLRNVYEVLLLIKEDNQVKNAEAYRAEMQLENIPESSSTEAGELTTERTEAEKKQNQAGNLASGEKINEITEKPEGIKKSETDKKQDLHGSPAEKPKKEAEILAEKFNKESSINENLGIKRSGDVTSKLASQPIDSISRNIGINDRFYIIRELFNGDAESYNKIISNLDHSNNFNEAFSIIENRFPDTIEHTGVQILVNLARRRFISSGNV